MGFLEQYKDNKNVQQQVITEQQQAVALMSQKMTLLFSSPEGSNLKRIFNDSTKCKQYLATVIAQVQNNPKLAEADFSTFVIKICEAAILNYLPGRDCYFIPYKGKVSLVPKYSGLVKSVFNDGYVTSLQCHIVYESEEFQVSYGLDRKLHHIPSSVPYKERGSIVGCYVTYKTRFNDIDFHYMPISDIYYIRDRHTKVSKYSPWYEGSKHSENWMIKKTVIKQAVKLFPQSTHATAAIQLENAVVSDQPQTNINIDIDANAIETEAKMIEAKQAGTVAEVTAMNDKEKSFTYVHPGTDNTVIYETRKDKYRKK